ncbi:hypothetical protein Tco_0634704 [Tanacetum coccineum]
MQIIGYQRDVDKVRAFFMKYLAQPLQTMFKQKKDVIQYARFTKLIIADLMEKFDSITKRLEEDYYSLKDDILLVSVYTITKVQEKILEEDIENIVKESYASTFAESVYQDDNDSGTRIEPESCKESPKVVDDNDVDDNVDKEMTDDGENDDHTDDTLIKEQVMGSLETRNEKI